MLNASNIQVGGTATGIPTVVAPNIGALTSASNTTGASAKAVETPTGSTKNSNQPSVIIVEVIGNGGGDGENQQQDQQRKDQRSDASDSAVHHYDRNSTVQFLGLGVLSENQSARLTPAERQNLKNQAPRNHATDK